MGGYVLGLTSARTPYRFSPIVFLGGLTPADQALGGLTPASSDHQAGSQVSPLLPA